MSPFDDDPDDMTPPLDDLDDLRVEQLLRGTATHANPRLAELLSQARSLSQGPAPEPSGALAALLALPAGAPAPTSLASHRWRRRVATLALVSAGSTASLVGAAAANVLPAQAQHAVARVVHDVTPLALPGARGPKHPHPHPHVRPQHPTVPAPVTTSPAVPGVGAGSTAPAPSTSPAPHAAPTPGTTPTPQPSPHPTGSANNRGRDGRQGTGDDGTQGNRGAHSTGKPSETPGSDRGHDGSQGKGAGDGHGSHSTGGHATHSSKPSRTSGQGKSGTGDDGRQSGTRRG